MYVLCLQGPFYAALAKVGFYIYEALPVDLFSALTGLGLSFFGGVYCASIAAVEVMISAEIELLLGVVNSSSNTICS